MIEVDPKYEKEFNSAASSATGQAGMPSMGGLGNMATTVYDHISEIRDTYRSDPSKYFNETYTQGQNPQGFQWQENPYSGSGWKIAENAVEGAGAFSSLGPLGMAFGALGGAVSGGVNALLGAEKRGEFEREQQAAFDRYNQAVSSYDQYQAQQARNRAQVDYMERIRNSAIPEYGGSIYQYM